MASSFKPNPRGLREMQRKLEKELKKYPVRVPVQTETTGSVSPSSGSASVVGGSVTGSELELVAGWLIDWLYEYSKTNRSSLPPTSRMMAELGVEDRLPLVEQHVDVAYDSLGERGLINEVKAFRRHHMSRSAMLTDSGRETAVARIESRKDARARRGACRNAVMRWVYERVANGESTEIAEIANSPYGWFNGVLFSAADLMEAVRFLQERRLLGGTDEAPTLESTGTECVEQYEGVVEYLNRADGSGVNVTIMGNNSGQLAVANRDVAQSQTHTNDGQVLTVFAEALREFARLLPEDQQPQYEMVAAELERESAKDEPDKGWVRSLLDRSKGLLEGAPANLQHLAQVAKIGFDLYGQGLA
ncbi:hypothetical protein E1258_01350 [Micromonospora sp. KC207]|uniref:hypothetical protein n=1 Tax=Micromonospora sp. KC207 TaxID=2530377 RepID=UPI0010512834|nr:hypothetical protein [Micromonospora sp. KC207]TDC66912.1 hypothetical protein E1258_01350 [Micromonospora sp. KC207]